MPCDKCAVNQACNIRKKGERERARAKCMYVLEGIGREDTGQMALE